MEIFVYRRGAAATQKHPLGVKSQNGTHSVKNKTLGTGTLCTVLPYSDL